MNDELPMCCRTCAHKQSQYLYPAWTHRCTKAKPMVEDCRWSEAIETVLTTNLRIAFAWQRMTLRAMGLQ